MRHLGRAVLVVVGLLVIAAFAVVLNAGRLVKRAVEREGSSSLSLATMLDRATVSLLGGNLGLNGFAIASPRGFSAPQMLEVGHVGIAVSYRELKQQPIHVGSITIDKPTLVIEQSGGALNFRKAMELMPAPSPGKEPMKLVIDELKLEGARVLVRPGLPGLAQEVTVEVPSMTLKDIGRGRGAQNGAAVKDVAMHVISALAAAAAQSDAVPAQVRALLHLNAAQVAAQLGAEAQKRIVAAVPGAVGKALSGVVQDPAATAKDPAALLKGLGAKR